MSINDYFKIRNFCNKILISRSIKNIKFYYQYLFVLKESPEVMFQYNDLFFLTKKKNIINKRKKNFYKKLIKYIKSFFEERKYFFNEVNKSKNVDLLIFSHLVQPYEHYKNLEDFYYGKLPSELIKSKINFKIIYKNLSNYKNHDNFLNKKYSITLPNSIGIINELVIFLKCLFFYFIFKYQLKKFFQKSNLKEVKFFLRLENFYSIINNLRFEYLTYYLIKKLQPKNIITTFEGHSWERILFKIANSYKNNIKVYAYQHSMLTQFQNTLFLDFPKILSPYEIFTTGQIVNNRFKNLNFKNTTIIGSPKNINSKITSKSKKNHNDFLNVLILPDAYVYEVEILLNLLISIYKKDKINNYYIRLHPKTNLNEINKNIINSIMAIPNISLSRQSLEDDINLCDIVIYRGTATIIQSCISGIYPMYFNNNEKISFDPLFEFFHDKSNHFDNYEDLMNKFNYFKKNWHINNIKKNDLQKYCNLYFEKINYQKIINKL